MMQEIESIKRNQILRDERVTLGDRKCSIGVGDKKRTDVYLSDDAARKVNRDPRNNEALELAFIDAGIDGVDEAIAELVACQGDMVHDDSEFLPGSPDVEPIAPVEPIPPFLQRRLAEKPAIANKK